MDDRIEPTFDRDDSRSSHSTTSLTLLQLAKIQDREAWQELVEQYGPRIYRWVNQSGVPPQDAPDVVQEVLQAVVRNLGRFRRQTPQAFRRWLRTITRSKVSDHFRRVKRAPMAKGGTTALQWIQEQREACSEREETSPGVHGEGGPRAPSPALTLRVVDEVRARLKPNTWEAFWRTAVDGKLPADVAAELGMPVASVWKARSRVAAMLRAAADR